MKSFRALAAVLAASLLWCASAQAQVVQSPSSLISVTRAQTVTSYCSDSSGVMTGFAANTPRVCTGTGLLVEPAATNLAIQSQWPGGGAAPTSWSANAAGSSPVASVFGAPGSAYLFAASASRPFLFQVTPALSASTTYVMSVLVEDNSGAFQIQNLVGIAVPPAGSVVSYPQGATTVPTAGTRIYAQVVVSTTPGTAQIRAGAGIQGASTGNATLSAPQLEALSPTSYIPTTTVAVTRNADNITAVAGGPLYSGLNSQTGSIISAFNVNTISATVPTRIFDTNTGQLGAFTSASSGTWSALWVGNGSPLTANTITAGVTAKGGFGWQSGAQSAVLNGGSIATNNTAGPFATGTVTIGNRSALDRPLNGYISRLTLYPTKIADATLQAGTTSISPPAGYALDLNFAAGTYVSSGALLLASTPPPSLSLDFANGNYIQSTFSMSDVISVTRAQAVASYCKTVAGTLAPFAADTLRRTDAGACIEGSATNIVLQANFASGWTTTQSTLAPASVQSPVDGVNTLAATLTENTATSTHTVVSASIAKAASNIQYTGSVYGKANGRRLILQMANAGFSGGSFAIFDVATGQATATTNYGAWTSSTASIQVSGNGYFRVSVTATSNTDTTLVLQMQLDNGSGTGGLSNNYTGNGTSGVQIFCAQIETGPTASSCIPSGASAATRNGDAVNLIGPAAAIMDGPAWSAILETAGSPITTGTYLGGSSVFWSQVTASIVRLYNGANTLDATLGSGTVAAPTRAAMAVDGVGRSNVINNGTVATDTNPKGTWSTKGFGNSGAGSASTNQIFRSLALYPTRLDNTTLKNGSVVGSPYPGGFGVMVNLQTNTVTGITRTTAEANVTSGNTTGGYAQNADGSLTWKYGPVTNLILQSNAPATTPWSDGSNGVGTGTATATNSTTTGPGGDGLTTAGTVALSARSATTRTQQIIQSATVTAQVYLSSAWIKATTGGDVGKVVNIWQANGSTAINVRSITLTADWQRYSTPVTTVQSAGAGRYLTVVGRLDNSLGGPSDLTAVSFDVAGIQAEVLSYPTQTAPGPYVATTTTSAASIAQLRIGTGTGLGSFDAVTNLTIQSEDMTTRTIIAGAITADQAIAPNGALTADLMTGSGSTEVVRNPSVAITAGATYTVSQIIKTGNIQWVQFKVGGTTSFTNSANCWFDIQGGAFGVCSNTGTGWTASGGVITPMTGGFYRISFQFVSSTDVVAIIGTNSAASAGSGTRANVGGGVGVGVTYYPWGQQTELGAFVKPYCPTLAAAFTCSADGYLAASSLLSISQQPAASLVFGTVGVQGPTSPRFGQWAGGAFMLFTASTFLGISNNTNSANATIGGALTWASPIKTCFSWDTGNMSAVSNGGTFGTTAFGMANNTGAFSVGGNSSLTRGLNGYIRSLSAFNSRLPQAACSSYSIN